MKLSPRRDRSTPPRNRYAKPMTGKDYLHGAFLFLMMLPGVAFFGFFVFAIVCSGIGDLLKSFGYIP